MWNILCISLETDLNSFPTYSLYTFLVSLFLAAHITIKSLIYLYKVNKKTGICGFWPILAIFFSNVMATSIIESYFSDFSEGPQKKFLIF